MSAPDETTTPPGKDADTMQSEATGTDPNAATIAKLDARALLGARSMVHIDLDGELYTLRLTRNNRLILTK